VHEEIDIACKAAQLPALLLVLFYEMNQAHAYVEVGVLDVFFFQHVSSHKLIDRFNLKFVVRAYVKHKVKVKFSSVLN
jgi:hypothetical protein